LKYENIIISINENIIISMDPKSSYHQSQVKNCLLHFFSSIFEIWKYNYFNQWK